tara:strand:+ start:1319 stop:1738 length:420 start_codon:yes stop_codon:yes gene_type:complete
MEKGRRMTDKEGSGHFDITQRNVRDIGEIRSDISGLKVGMDALGNSQSSGFASQSAAMERLSKQLSHFSQPKETNWAQIGSLIVAVIVVFGSIFGFLFYAQASNTQAVSAALFRLEDRMLANSANQEDLNMQFISGDCH